MAVGEAAGHPLNDEELSAGIIQVLLGVFPKIGALIAIIPSPVLGGAGIIMFGMVASSGIKTIRDFPLNNRKMIIIAVSFGIGLGVTVRPEFLSQMSDFIKILFSSGISAGTITALILNIVLKEEMVETKDLDSSKVV